MPQTRKGRASALPKKDRAEGATALPKAGVKPEGRNDLVVVVAVAIAVAVVVALAVLAATTIAMPQKPGRAGLQRVLKKSVLLKGTASAVPQTTRLQCGFSR